MDDFQKMVISAKKAMAHVMKMSKQDAVLVVTDENSKSIGEAFYNAAIDYGCRAQYYFLSEKKRPILEIPKELSELAKDNTMVINVFKG